jgi:hypothetical protein
MEDCEDPLLTKTSRRLYYPKFKFCLSFTTSRKYVGYVGVTTRYTVKATAETLDFSLGTTETRTSELGDVEPIVFHQAFEIPYQVSVDDNQLLIFEIFDGDHMMTTEGYLLNTKILPLLSLSNPKFSIPIYRGADYFGALEVRTTFDIDCQKACIDCDLDAMARIPHSFSNIAALNNPLYYDKIVMGYFPYKAPSLADIREQHPSIANQSSKSFEFGVHATKICPIPKATMKKLDSSIFLKLCDCGEPGFEPDIVAPLTEDGDVSLLSLTAAQKEELRSREEADQRDYKEKVLEWANEMGMKDNLTCIWQSLHISLKPYEILVDKLTLTEHDFPAGKHWLTFQVYVTNWDEFAVSVKPKLVAYFVVASSEFISGAGSTFTRTRNRN